jgi:ABC-2 type transport system permease protein
MGPTISSRRGRDIGTVLVALAVTTLSLASAVVPFVARKLTDGTSPVLSDAVRALASGWGAVAVDAAGHSDWGRVAFALGGLAALIGTLVLAWPPLLKRRLTLSARSRSKTKRIQQKGTQPARSLLPSTPLGAVIGKELRMYARSMLRSVQLMIALLVGVLACVIPALSGNAIMLPFAGPLFTVIAAACFTNLYGDDGSALWLTLVSPGVERDDVRGRQRAWLLVVGPTGLLLTLALTALSGQMWAWPWVLAGEPALLLGSSGLLLTASVLATYPLSQDGGPTPPRQVKVNLMLIVLPVVAALPAAPLLIAGSAGGSSVIAWLAVPVGVVWGAALCRYGGRFSQSRLEARGPELFQAVRNPAG